MGTNYQVIPKEYKAKSEKAREVKEQLKSILEAQRDVFEADAFTVAYDSVSYLEADYEEIHIGKNSYGWRFIFNSLNFQGLEDFKIKFNPETHLIMDEYRKEVSLEEFIKVVEDSLKSPIQPNQLKEKYNSEGFRLYAGEFS